MQTKIPEGDGARKPTLFTMRLIRQRPPDPDDCMAPGVYTGHLDTREANETIREIEEERRRR